MEIQQFIEKFVDALDDVNIKSIGADTVFKNLSNWSSLSALSIIAMIDEEYGIVIKGADIREATTIEDLFNIVKAK